MKFHWGKKCAAILLSGIMALSAFSTTLPVFAESTNLALGKSVTASGTEVSYYGAEKLVDGIINRTAAKNKQSRWSSNTQSGEKWVQIDFQKVVSIQSIVLEWERRNAVKYQIDFSTNGNKWQTVYKASGSPKQYKQVITLQKPENARYLKLLVTKFNADSDEVNWPNISLYEIEAYGEKLPETYATAKEIAYSLKAPVVKKGDTHITMPSVPKDCSISLDGADYEQVVGADGRIYPPISNTTVALTFKVTKNGESAISREINVEIPGIYSQGQNSKPQVIPELREWHGDSGSFTPSGRIAVNPLYKKELQTAAEEFSADYKDITGKKSNIVYLKNPAEGDFYLTLGSKDHGLGEEGYYIRVGQSAVLEASNNTGVYWATRSVLQILKQTKGTLPKGTTRDYPKFRVRGFMLDAARKPVSMQCLQNIVKTMSWYKMNDFQVHLNDNYNWLKDYGSMNNAIKNAYSAFRLESYVKSKDSKPLTSSDFYYTKEEFGRFIDSSKVQGVHIVPEIDVPGHALAYTKVHPEFVYKNSFGHVSAEDTAMLDATNPQCVKFIKSVFDEYIDGANPVFRDSVVHIGSDEFYGNAEQYRQFTNTMLTYLLKKGRTPRLWGSLTSKHGKTPVVSKGVQMDIWNKGWADPKEMYHQGYDLINILDKNLYIVPGANYYRNYLDTRYLYNTWTPNNFDGEVIPAGDKQMLGGAFALWNDMIDLRANGISDYDIFNRVYPAIQVICEKMWGNAQDKTYEQHQKLAQKIAFAPRSNPTYQVTSKGENVLNFTFNGKNTNDTSSNGYNAVETKNTTWTQGHSQDGIALHSGCSYIKLPVQNLGPNYSASMWVKRDKNSTDEEQILLDSSLGQFKAVQKDTGKVGFSREGYDYSFNYTLPKGQWVKLGICGEKEVTKLFVNDVYVDEVSRANTVIKKSGNGGATVISTPQFGTFVLPLQYIGSKTNSFNGVIDDFEVYNVKNMTDKSIIPHSQMTASATSEKNPPSGTDGPASFAIDDDIRTMWHINYPNTPSLPQSITLELKNPQMIHKVTYLPRQDGNDNGIITKYKLDIADESGKFIKVSEGSWKDNARLKVIEFKPVKSQKIRLTALKAANNFVSASEINVYKVLETPVDKTGLQALISESNSKIKKEYTPESWNTFADALVQAEKVLKNENASAQEVKLAERQLKQVIKMMKKNPPKASVNVSKLEQAVNSAEKLDLTGYILKGQQQFEQALNNAKKTLKTKISQKEIDAACNMLQRTRSQLEKKADLTALRAAVSKAEELNKSQYTQESCTPFVRILSECENFLKQEHGISQQKEIERLTSLLQKAQNNLQKTPDIQPQVSDDFNKKHLQNLKSVKNLKTGESSAVLQLSFLVCCTFAALYKLKEENKK